jgi:hypothetical protein
MLAASRLLSNRSSNPQRRSDQSLAMLQPPLSLLDGTPLVEIDFTTTKVSQSFDKNAGN